MLEVGNGGMSDTEVGGTKGVFRSTDEGSHWVRVSDDDHQYGIVNVVEGDPREFGRVYLGPNGRGDCDR